ncbi:MAG: HAD family hydrolase [Pseudomonadota bacterium]
MGANPSFDLVIFDCDGVLIDSEHLACGADAQMLTEAGYPITTEEVAKRFAGVPHDAMYATIEDDWGQALPAEFKDQVLDHITTLYRTELQPIPGVVDMLQRLDLPKCVASSSAPSKLALGLVETDLFDVLYPHIYSVALVERGKPHPDIFLYAADQHAIAPARCLVVEDSTAGVCAAKAAGMTALGFTGGSHCPSGHDKALRAAGADHVIANISDVLKVTDT